jgi:hypothetical protein
VRFLVASADEVLVMLELVVEIASAHRWLMKEDLCIRSGSSCPGALPAASDDDGINWLVYRLQWQGREVSSKL